MTFNLLLFAHFVGLMLVATAFIGLLGLLPKPGRDPEQSRSPYLTQLGHWGIIIAIVSGGLMLWVRYGGFDGITHWFWAKMGFLLILVAGVVTAAMSAKKMRAGDAAAASRVRLGRLVAAGALILTVLFAVMAFG
jgi:protoporphyrinogen IX oxidase